MKVAAVETNSIADVAGVRAGDEIVSVNGHAVRDSLDFIFRIAEDLVRLRVRRSIAQARGGAGVRRTGRGVNSARAVGTFAIDLVRDDNRDLGIVLAPDPVRRCANKCVFCFIDQNPRGLRPSLYVKDEDFRLSLLHGNYVTLTAISGRDIDRIIAQHLSPLYVSVHATDPAVRKSLLRCPGRGEILPILERLARGGIRMHAQIVVVPEYNDGAVLTRTLDDLEKLYPGVASVAIVPVGLTSHRRGLPPLRRMTAADARALLRAVAPRRKAALARFGSRLHFPADEIYLLAGRPLPRAADYEGFPQIENGVGMVRRFEADLRAAGRLLPDATSTEARAGLRIPSRSRRRLLAHVVTGTLFAPLLTPRLDRVLQRTGESGGWKWRVLAARNDLFGSDVSVAGLLGGADMIAALEKKTRADLAVLPPEAFNSDGLTLDGMTAQSIAKKLSTPVQIGLGRNARWVA